MIPAIQNLQSTIGNPTVVIGAGIGGLSAAIRLAAAGQQVVVLEQNAQVGGKMSQVTAAGFRWDTGPSVITMRHVFEELFAGAGRSLQEYLTLQPIEPLTRYVYPDGTQLDVTKDWPALAKSFLRVSPLAMTKIDPWFTLDQSIRRFVRSPHLRQLLGRFATYVGASPYAAPATLGVIAHVELTGGVWYPRGGIYAIAVAMQRLAEELGVEIRTGQRVQQITVKGGRATGVTLADGTALAAQAVVANVDVTTVYEQLLPPGPVTRRMQQKLAAIEPSCSGYVLLLGIEGQHPTLAHHNIFFAPDYRREFEDIFRRGIPPRDPTIYVAITSKSDPDHAPPGCENWFVLVNAPPLGSSFDWKREEAAYRQHVLATLAGFGYVLHDRIRHLTVLTPVDLAQRTGAWRGALYGLSSNQMWNAFRRPHNRAPQVRGLYFVGGTTHPGGGVPMVTLSGKVAAEMVLADRSLGD